MNGQSRLRRAPVIDSNQFGPRFFPLCYSEEATLQGTSAGIVRSTFDYHCKIADDKNCSIAKTEGIPYRVSSEMKSSFCKRCVQSSADKSSKAYATASRLWLSAPPL